MKTVNRYFVFAAIIICTVVLRYLNVSALNDTQFAQFSPIIAISLFAGAYFKNLTEAVIVSVLSILLSDVLINTVYYHGQYGILGSSTLVNAILLSLTSFIGFKALKNSSVLKYILAGTSSVLVFWLVSNLMVWIGGGQDIRTTPAVPLTKDWAGLRQCYIQAIPFLKNFASGTAIYGIAIFGSYELLKRKAMVPAMSK